MSKIATGKVEVLYVHEVTRIGLSDTIDVLPKDSEFVLRRDHPNFNALYSMALSAAINHYTLRIGTTTEITPGEEAEVERMWIRW
jgi:hypothetical protein